MPAPFFSAPLAVCDWPKIRCAGGSSSMSDTGPSRLSRFSAGVSGTAKRLCSRLAQRRLLDHENAQTQAACVLSDAGGAHGSLRVIECILKGIGKCLGLLGNIAHQQGYKARGDLGVNHKERISGSAGVSQ